MNKIKDKVQSQWPQGVGAFLFIMLDGILTFFGQPPEYWENHENNNELSWIFEPALRHSPEAFLVAVLIYALFITSLALFLPRMWGLGIGIGFIMAHFAASLNWLTYIYGLGYNTNFWFPPICAFFVIYICFDQCERYHKERTI